MTSAMDPFGMALSPLAVWLTGLVAIFIAVILSALSEVWVI